MSNNIEAKVVVTTPRTMRAAQIFLEEYNLSGKTIIPFCTHEGSSFGSSVNDLKKECPKSKFLDGLAVRGSDVKKAQKEVNAWDAVTYHVFVRSRQEG